MSETRPSPPATWEPTWLPSTDVHLAAQVVPRSTDVHLAAQVVSRSTDVHLAAQVVSRSTDVHLAAQVVPRSTGAHLAAWVNAAQRARRVRRDDRRCDVGLGL